MKLFIAISATIMIIAACASSRSNVTQDTLLADQGYQELLQGNYERAEATLRVALSINSKNPYALLNLGVLYQNTGRLEEAREMYQKLIALNPEDVAAQSTSRRHKGAKLVKIARENLSALGFASQKN